MMASSVCPLDVSASLFIEFDDKPMRYNTAMKNIEFTLEPDREYVELNQLLKLVGLCGSGGMGKAIVASGIVSVNGHTELRKTCKIVAGDIVRIEDHEIHVA